MKSRFVSLAGVVLLATLVIDGNTLSALAADWPVKGRAVSIIVPYAAGGSNDIGARLLAPFLEKDLGTPFLVVNRVGGSGQVGWSFVAMAKPDGYTVGMVNLPSVNLLALDPERKATFSRKSYAMVALTSPDTNSLAVRADSPYKTLKDLIEDAKARPDKVKLAAGTILGSSHVAAVQLAKTSGVKFAMVHFDGGAPGRTALLGGHVDTIMDNSSGLIKLVQDGQFRLLGITGKQESKFFPGVKTFESQGYQVYLSPNQGFVLPAGTPKEIVDTLAGSIKKAMTAEDMQKRMTELGLDIRYLGPAEFAVFWEDVDSQVGPVLDTVKKQ